MDNKKCDIKLLGTSTIGPKGQVVIPKELRDKLDIKPGDNFVFLLKDGKYIGMVRNEDINDLLDYVGSM